MHLTSLRRYPVKSCRGESLTDAVVQPWGLLGDRRWMVVGTDGEAITAREANGMLLLQPQLVPGGLRITAPGLPELTVDEPSGGAPVEVTVHGKPLRAQSAGDESGAWFSRAVDKDARLVYLDDPTCRPANPRFGRPGDVVSFADGYPLLLTSESSLAQLDGWVAQRHGSDHQPLSMTRFRPNLVVSGAAAWAEDDWRRIRVGEAVFRVVKGCDRCVMTTVDPESARRGKEPIATLARHRRFDGSTWFGMNLIPDTPGAPVRLGDDIEVLDRVPAGDGPPR